MPTIFSDLQRNASDFHYESLDHYLYQTLQTWRKTFREDRQ